VGAHAPPRPPLRRATVHSRIADLRRRGHHIEHRNRRFGRKCLSEYRLFLLKTEP